MPVPLLFLKRKRRCATQRSVVQGRSDRREDRETRFWIQFASRFPTRIHVAETYQNRISEFHRRRGKARSWRFRKPTSTWFLECDPDAVAAGWPALLLTDTHVSLHVRTLNLATAVCHPTLASGTGGDVICQIQHPWEHPKTDVDTRISRPKRGTEERW